LLTVPFNPLPARSFARRDGFPVLWFFMDFFFYTPGPVVGGTTFLSLLRDFRPSLGPIRFRGMGNKFPIFPAVGPCRHSEDTTTFTSPFLLAVYFLGLIICLFFAGLNGVLTKLSEAPVGVLWFLFLSPFRALVRLSWSFSGLMAGLVQSRL